VVRRVSTSLAPLLELPALDGPPPGGTDATGVVRHATALTNRAVAYLDRRRG
jgi:hypothetical protein